MTDIVEFMMLLFNVLLISWEEPCVLLKAFNAFPHLKKNGIILENADIYSDPLTVPDRMSCGQQLRR